MNQNQPPKSYTDQFLDALLRENMEEAAILAEASIAKSVLLAAAQSAEFNEQTLEDQIPLDLQEFSIGHACQLAGLSSPAQLRAVMRSTGASFHRSVDDVAYLNGRAMLLILRWCHEFQKAGVPASDHASN